MESKGFWFLFLAIASTLLIFQGCSEDDDPNPVNPADSICYTDLQPDVTITPVRYMHEPTLQYNCNYPVPSDSSADYKIDVDLDGTNDFRIHIETWYEFHSASDPCMNLMYYSSIGSLGTGDSIAITDMLGRCADVIDKGETISGALMFSERAETVRNYWYAVPCEPGSFAGDAYFAIKLDSGKGAMFGWILLSLDWNTFRLTIREFAYNKTPGNDITAGQKE